jgi:hypothetical protein
MGCPKWIKAMKRHFKQREANETTTSQSDTGHQKEWRAQKRRV